MRKFNFVFIPLLLITIVGLAEDPPEPQVMIESKIVETSKEFARELGINMGFGPVFSNFTHVENSPGSAVGFNILGGVDFWFHPVVGVFANATITQFGDKDKSDGGKQVIKFTNVGVEMGLELHIVPRIVDTHIIVGVTAGGNVNGVQKYKNNGMKDKERITFSENDNRGFVGVMGGVGGTVRTDIGDFSLSVIFTGGLTQVYNNTNDRSVPFFVELPFMYTLFKNKPKAAERELLIFIKPQILESPED